MSIPHARRAPIPDIFRLESSFEKSKPIKPHNELPPPIDPVPPSSLPQRHFMLPAPADKKGKVKYVPFSRASKVNTKALARPTDQNVPVPPSPAQTSSTKVSEESTLVASTPPSPNEFESKEPIVSSKIFVETTNCVPPSEPVSIPDETSNKESSADDNETANEQHVLTAISDSTNGNMNLHANTAHLETAASLRSIRGTLTQLRKNRARSRQSRTHVEDIFKTDTSDIEEPRAPRLESITNLVSQLLNIIKPRSCSDHKSFMVEWGKTELAAYNSRWDKLLRVVISTRIALRFAEIPWPVLPALAITSPSPVIITRDNVTRFLICPHRDQKASSLERIFTEIERWDDFQLMNSILRKVHEEDKKRVEEAWSRVVLVLMEMRGEFSSD